MLSHYNVSAMCTSLYAHHVNAIYPHLGADFNPDDEVTMFLLPFYHAYGNGLMINHMMRGHTAVILSQFEPELFLKTIQDYKIRNVNVVPPIIVFLAKHPIVAKYDLSSLEVLGSGAAPLGQDLSEEVKKRIPSLKYVFQGKSILL